MDREIAAAAIRMSHGVCFFDPPAPGAWNMAFDEALLERAAQGTTAVLRFYQWSEPTLSLGYFQRFADRYTHEPSGDCTSVRRASGGGAILHDRELTYSLTLPAGHHFSRRANDLYRISHQALVEALADGGISTMLHEPDDSPPTSHDRAEPFMCFARRTRGDVLVNQWKVAGSAQRRSRSAVLQHGSIFLGQSKFAPELPGLLELTGRSIVAKDLADRIQSRLAVHLGCEFDSRGCSVELIEAARHVEAAKFADPRWLHLR
jgi:lipoate-protein ligase A